MSKPPKPVILALIAFAGILAQSLTRPKFTEFEVASIKPATESPARFIRMQGAQRFEAKNHSVKTLLAAAYNLNPHAISGGPAWIDSERYDILAKTPGDVRPNLNEQMAMLRALLAARFNLAFHRELKELSIYALTVAKGGPKLNESTASPDASPEGPPPLIFVVTPELIRLPGRNATIAELASVMQRAALDHPVVDRTGLSARYDFDLEFTPDETQFGGVFAKRSIDDTGKPGLSAALQQQLGLRMEATKGKVETLVIDRVDHPSGN